jgi:hypothetical protein
MPLATVVLPKNTKIFTEEAFLHPGAECVISSPSKTFLAGLEKKKKTFLAAVTMYSKYCLRRQGRIPINTTDDQDGATKVVDKAPGTSYG